MSGPWRVDRDVVTLEVGAPERRVLASVPVLIETAGDAGGRLDYSAHPHDAEADARYRDLVGDDLSALRRQDLTEFEGLVGGASSSFDGLEAFMRVVGDARIVLAQRLGIDDEGWEAELDPRSDPEVALLAWLGYLQDEAVAVLSEGL